MTSAVITSYARTGITKARRGAFNATPVPTLAAHAIRHCVERSHVEPEAVQDVVLGNVAHNGNNPARLAGLLAGLPTSTGGATVNRFCSSGLNALAIAANHIRAGDAEIIVAGGVESVSLPGERADFPANIDPRLVELHPDIYMSMIDTAEVVAKRYNVSREQQDAYSLSSQQRTAAAQELGLFADEIIPMTARMSTIGPEAENLAYTEVCVDRDECNRPGTTLDTLAGLTPVSGEGTSITAGNSSQLTDGGAALMVMSEMEASRRDLKPLGRFVGWSVVGNEPDEMGIGPVFAVPPLLRRHGLTIDDIDLWELNEAFASQALYCRDRLGIDPAKYNVNGGSIAIGHPFGMTGVRMAGHLLLQGRRRCVHYGVATMCLGKGGGAAALFEFY